MPLKFTPSKCETEKSTQPNLEFLKFDPPKFRYRKLKRCSCEFEKLALKLDIGIYSSLSLKFTSKYIPEKLKTFSSISQS